MCAFFPGICLTQAWDVAVTWDVAFVAPLRHLTHRFLLIQECSLKKLLHISNQVLSLFMTLRLMLLRWEIHRIPCRSPILWLTWKLKTLVFVKGGNHWSKNQQHYKVTPQDNMSRTGRRTYWSEASTPIPVLSPLPKMKYSKHNPICHTCR